jgi:hypothetical protein
MAQSARDQGDQEHATHLTPDQPVPAVRAVAAAAAGIRSRPSPSLRDSLAQHDAARAPDALGRRQVWQRRCAARRHRRCLIGLLPARE